MNDLSPAQRWSSVHNLVPFPYRRVSVQPYSGPMTVDAIAALLLSREAYRRTDFIVLRGEESKYAVVAITDRKSTRLNSSHQIISYAVFCLKKKKHHQPHRHTHSRHPATLY